MTDFPVRQEPDPADRRWFELDAAQFAEFEALLNQPVRDLPKVRDLTSPNPETTEERQP